MDVAAFAYAGGGLVVWGFKGRKRPTEFHEVAEKVTPFDKRLVSGDLCKDVIAGYVRPLLAVNSSGTSTLMMARPRSATTW
ncbi:hypothetical protein RKE29_15085 [Streptomyces sp. B1866]|uniref:hypothetical protein n=1 Tax=Streptomyces sp. B1866 TaxID=3075431 RepID=UPI0028912DFC|nr:hypothetical protein [Streptomyces sp. B1866]MDT3397952.1 hypothetical protein [Streptomyces sp. B1866]